ncbi:hypothetical protein WKT02_07880 [Erysipelotrichaceae bacterium HCN-30851]
MINRKCIENSIVLEGRTKKKNRSYIKVEEIRKRMETENDDEIAESLRISRATLFRRLKNTEEKNEK